MRTVKKILKTILFLIASVIVGYIPAFLCVFVGSCVLLVFGTDVSEGTGDVILWILTILIGMYTVADMTGKIKK